VSQQTWPKVQTRIKPGSDFTDNPLVKALVFLFVFLWVFVGKAADICSKASSSTQDFDKVIQQACETQKKSEVCQKLYAELKAAGENPDDKALRCEAQSGFSRAFEQNWSYTSGCAVGGWNFIRNTFVDLGIMIGEGAAKMVISAQSEKKENAICDKSLSYKKSLFISYNQSVPKILQIDFPKEDFLKGMPCSYLKLIVREQREQKIHDTEKEVSRKEFWSWAKKPTFTAQEKEFIQWRDSNKGPNLLALAKQKLNELGVKLDCYNSEAAAAMTCEAIAEVASLAGGAATAAFKAEKIQNILKIAGLARDEEKIGISAKEAKRTAKLLKKYDEGEKKDAEIRALVRPSAVDTEAFKNQVKSIWDNPNLDDGEKLKATFDQYAELRTAPLDAKKKELADKALRKVDHGHPDEGAYDKDGTISIGRNLRADSTAYHSTLAHELEHLTQYGTEEMSKVHRRSLKEMILKRVSVPSGPTSRLHAEFEAIGAQWDFLQGVPKEVREESLRRIAGNEDLPQHLKEMLKVDIENASLSREEYIKQVPKFHGYASANYKDSNALTSISVDRTLTLGAFIMTGYAGYEFKKKQDKAAENSGR
jgi:hypothetical protein